jgi:hypothetical protein
MGAAAAVSQAPQAAAQIAQTRLYHTKQTHMNIHAHAG